jgi:two-component system sensor histidine kinase HydH
MTTNPLDFPPLGDSQRSVRRLKATRVRLIISIPTLLLLLTLGTGLFSYQYLLGRADMQKFLAAAAPTHAQATKHLEMEGILEESAIRVLRISLALSLAAVVVGLVLALQIIRPIRELTETARQLVHGDLSRRPRIPHLGEFADLGMTFNRVVDHLQRLFRERNRILEGGAEANIVWLDFLGRVKSMDPSAATLFSRSADHLIGQSIFDLIPELSQMEEFRQVFRAEEKSPPLERPLTYMVETSLKPAETPLLLGITLALMRDQKNIPMGYLLMLRNLSALRSFHEQMMRADRLAALGTFATGMAHEIRNPLASVKGMVQLLGEMRDTERLPAFTERIVEEIARMELLIAEVMDFAQPEALQPVATNLVTLAREALETAISRCNPQQHHIRITRELNPLPRCLAEPRRLHRALVNIMINAFEATPPGGEVVIRTQRLDDQHSGERPLVISIINTGEPVPPADRQRIFEPFYTTKSSGTGLGLPIAYQIIASNRGAIEVECSEGKTSFRIRLPESVPET